MDWDTREAAWQAQSANVFLPGDTRVPDSDFSKLSIELTSAHRLGIRLWWNIRSLEEYIRLNIVPRGLRIPIYPAWEPSSTFQATWEQGLLKCSGIIINMLLEHDRELLLNTKIRIKDLEGQLLKFDDVKQVQPFRARLKENLDKYEKDIVSKKKSKFTRDRSDFESARAFQWRHQGNQRRVPRVLRTRAPAQESTRGADFTSESDFFILSGKRGRRRIRRGRKRRSNITTDNQIWGTTSTGPEATSEPSQILTGPPSGANSGPTGTSDNVLQAFSSSSFTQQAPDYEGPRPDGPTGYAGSFTATSGERIWWSHVSRPTDQD
ncbi:uncharacterized protein LOC143788365 [Ranitomeya variabilis]|uniref:uncharacterized protein LOC143788365 n=1 Tax=Ranitomeya variabilis TaxID=490064 RepID=UPI004055B16B